MNNKYWLHRIKYEMPVSHHMLFNEKYLTIGWRGYMKDGLLDEVCNNGLAGFNSFMDQKGNVKRNKWSLYKFLTFKKGDTVIVPVGSKVAICVVEEDVIPLRDIKISKTEFKNTWTGKTVAFDSSLNGLGLYDKDNQEPYDLGFAVKVKIIHEKQPRDYARPALIARMKIRGTTVGIDDLKDAVEDFKVSGRTPSLYEKLIETLSKEIITSIQERVEPRKLETLIKWYMSKVGADTVDIPAKNEANKENGADADVIAIFDDLKVVFYIQAKHHWGKTNAWSVHQVSQYKEQKEDVEDDYTYISWVISMAEDFTDAAKEQAMKNSVRLINGQEFVKMLMHVGFKNIDECLK